MSHTRTALETLDSIESLLMDCPPGPDMEADQTNTQPEDATAHNLGLALQEIERLRRMLEVE